MESLQSLLIISLLSTYQIVIHRVINIVMNKIVNNGQTVYADCPFFCAKYKENPDVFLSLFVYII